MSSDEVEYKSPASEAFERIDAAWRATAETLAEWTFATLVNRVDAWGAYLPVRDRDKGRIALTRPYQKERGKLFLTSSMVARHYRGSNPQTTIGLHALSAADEARWLVVDIDQKDVNASTAEKNDRFRLAIGIVDAFRLHGLQAVLEDSNGNGGFHIWCLFTAPVAASALLSFGRGVLRKIEAEKLELFPKQASVGKTGLGNWIRLPGRYHDGRRYWSRFWSGDHWLEGENAVNHWLSAPLNDLALLGAQPDIGAEREGSTGGNVGPANRREAMQALERLNPARADNYDLWIAVGQALHATEQSEAMLVAWDAWSQSSKKFEPGACAEKWTGFRLDGGRSLHTLRAWADEDDPPATKGRKKNESQRCFELVAECGGELWRTSDARAFVTVPNAGHREHLRISGKAFKVWLNDAFMGTYGRVPSAGSLTNAVSSLEANALQRGLVHDVAVRIGRIGDVIYVDLGRESWEVVEISSTEWRVVQDAPMRFFRPHTLTALPVPVLDGSVNALRGLGNFGDNDNFVLFVGWILAALRARKPFIILIIEGEQGCAKSTHTCLARWCVDPTNPPMRSQPDDERTLAIAALNTHVLAFDNLSRLPAIISDALCRISTGSGFGTRQLYTDQEEIVFDQARPVILNGITELATRPDLRDRSFVLNLPRIAETERRTEEDVWNAVGQLLPEILGALYTAVAVALRDHKQIKLENAPRMADVARWITASEPALGWRSGTFMEAYARNRRATVVYAVEHDVVASAIRSLAQRNKKWIGTPTLLLEVLDGIITESVKFSQEWPRSPRQLSDRVRRAIPDLREVGVLVHCDRGDMRRISIAATDDLAPPETEDEF